MGEGEHASLPLVGKLLSYPHRQVGGIFPLIEPGHGGLVLETTALDGGGHE
jgi:hypothetical protein